MKKFAKRYTRHLSKTLNLLKRRDFEYLRHILRKKSGINRSGEAEDKLKMYKYLETLLAGREKSIPGENVLKAINNFQQGKAQIDSMPVILDYCDTHLGCNISPPCGKCFLPPMSKIVYNFTGNEFKGLEKALICADVIIVGSLSEIMLDKNYPGIVNSMSTNETPRFSHISNGVLIKNHVKNIVGKVRSILVSLDAHIPGIYGKLQGKSMHLNLILSGLKDLADAKQKVGTRFPNVFLSFTISKENVDIFKDYYEYFLNPGYSIDVILLNRLNKFTNANPGRFREKFVFDFDEQIITDTTYFGIIKDLKKLSRNRKVLFFELIDYLTCYPILGKNNSSGFEGPVCPLPWIYMNCSIHGEVKLCCYSPTNLGNWREHGLDAVWNGKKMIRIRNQIANFGVALECLQGSCPVVHKLRYILQQERVAYGIDDLKKDWRRYAPMIRPFIEEVCKGTLRETPVFFDNPGH